MKIQTLIGIFFLTSSLIGCVKVSNKIPENETQKDASVERKQPNQENQQIQETLKLSGLIDNKESTDSEYKIVYRAHKIIIEDGTILRTNGASILIEANEIEALNWQIETFSAVDNGQNSALEVNGLNSGSIEIRVSQKASGNWQISPRGQAGGVGPRGLHAIERSDYHYPATGGPGNAGEIEYGDFLDPIHLLRGPRPTCGRQAGQGGIGEAGMDGLRGGEGFFGGDSGAVMIYLPKDSQAQVVVNRLPGAGGAGGPGGDGGPGGPGGPGGSEARIGSRIVCPAGPVGPQGANGQRGPVGNQGKPGNQQVACVQRGESRVCSDKLN